MASRRHRPRSLRSFSKNLPVDETARAVEAVLHVVGWLLAARHQRLDPAARDEGAFREVWLAHVMPLAIERS